MLVPRNENDVTRRAILVVMTCLATALGRKASAADNTLSDTNVLNCR